MQHSNLSRDLNVLVLSQRELTLCNSSLAQGGIAGVYDNPKDSPEYHKHDTFVAGGFENDPESTQVLVDEAYIDIGKLIELGADFDKCPDGSYHRTLERWTRYEQDFSSCRYHRSGDRKQLY